jgi:hypothetical protein
MNILLFAPMLPRAPHAAAAQGLLAALRHAGHGATLVRSENAHGTGTAEQPGWRDEALVRSLAAQADVIVYQLGDDARFDTGARNWLPHLPGVLWLCGGEGQDLARAYGARALGILASKGADLAPLLRCCPGPVLAVDGIDAGNDAGNAACAALLSLGRETQRALPVRAAADALAAILRDWGADEETIAGCGLAAGFDVFDVPAESGR